MLGAELQDFTIDQFAGSLALVLGSVGGLLMIIWKSRCSCKMNCCYLFQCSREPPPDNQESDEEILPKPNTTTEPSTEPNNTEIVITEP